MSDDDTLRISIEQVEDFEFRVRFDGTTLPALATDEPAPLGHDAGPNPARLLLPAVANCLAASPLFALRKFRNAPGPLRADATAAMGRNAEGRWRITGTDVEIRLADAAGAFQHLDRVLAQFESFCIVTESVRAGVPVAVRVRDAVGTLVHAAGSVA